MWECGIVATSDGVTLRSAPGFLAGGGSPAGRAREVPHAGAERQAGGPGKTLAKQDRHYGVRAARPAKSELVPPRGYGFARLLPSPLDTDIPRGDRAR